MSSSSHHLCNDLLADIFERLPPKSIIRFRSLSKYWYSRLATPEFIRNHRLQSPQKVLIRHRVLHPVIVGCSEHRDVYTLHSGDRFPIDGGSAGYVDIPGVELPSTFSFFLPSIVGSCNGILCLRDGNNICLWNLSIRRRVIASDNPRLFTSCYGSGFGFDPITDDYNVVTVSYNCNEYKPDENSTFIYSLKRDTWSAVPSPSTRFYSMDSRKACLFNGVLHWVVNGYLTAETTTENWSCFILTFDLSSHVFGHILLPDEPRRTRQVITINGCLAVVSSEGWIWVMKEYGKFESWCVLCEPPVTRVLFGYPMDVFQPIANADTLVYYKGEQVYNLETGLLIKVAQFVPCCSRFYQMEAYVESLELIDKQHAAACGETFNQETKIRSSSEKNSFSGCYLEDLFEFSN